MLPQILLPFDHLDIEAVEVTPDQIRLLAASTLPTATCPTCHTESRRVHGRYTRTLADVPAANRIFTIHLRMRRFCCLMAHCPRQTFAECVDPSLAAYARRTPRLTDALHAVAATAGGQAGARLAQQLAMPVSPRTLLRLLHAQATPPYLAPRVVGIDDWAWKKRRNYGTICVDLERHCPIDVLPDRSPDSLAAWLAAHPTIEVIARDRSGGYAEGATRGAPQATQVADRWHLLHNLRDALEPVFVQKRQLLKQTAQDINAQAQAVAQARLAPHGCGTGRTRASEATSVERHTAYVAVYHRIHALHAKAVDIANIAQQVGVSRRTVYRYLRMPDPPVRKQPVRRRRSSIERYKPYIVERWNEGCRSARQIYRELVVQGYQYGESSVQRYVHHLRLETGTRNKFRQAEPAQVYTTKTETCRPLTPVQAAHACLLRPQEQQPGQLRYLTALCAGDTTIANTYAQVQAFAEMLRHQRGEQLDAWLEDVQARGGPELRAFARGLQKDYAAVKAGLTLPYSNGQTEAQIHRLKLLKRQMYGKAGFELLRKRVLYRDVPGPIPQRLPTGQEMLAA